MVFDAMLTARFPFIAAVLVLGAAPVAQAQIQTSQVLDDQWFTGPLVATSPALPKAGLFVLEPYVITTLNTGRFLANGHHARGSNQARTASINPFVEYGITDRLTITASPTINYAWNDAATTRGAVASDLPVNLKYRFLDQEANTAHPSATVILGISFPTGPFDKLGSGLEGTGHGVYYARQGAVLQWYTNTYGNHPLRIRLWGFLEEPLNNPTVRDLNVYSTSRGFRGTAKPGLNATIGISPEYALSQRWVLAADLFRSYADGAGVSGTNNGTPFSTNSGSSASWVVAPGIEYNWSPRYGVITGVQLNVAGHNTRSYVAPQIALNIVF